MCMRGGFECDKCGTQWAPYSRLSPEKTGLVKCYACNNVRAARPTDARHSKTATRLKEIKAVSVGQ